jgi:hypothetical protein
MRLFRTPRGFAYLTSIQNGPIQMPTTITTPLTAADGKLPQRKDHFFALASLLVVVLAVWGFKDFYFHGRAFPNREIAPPVRPLVVAHGSLMSLWLLPLTAQSLLASLGHRKLHMQLGKSGGFVALACTVVGIRLAVVGMRLNPSGEVFGLKGPEFLAVPVISAVVFAAAVLAALAFRRNREVHSMLMLYGSAFALDAAIARIPVLNPSPFSPVVMYWFGPYFWAVVFGWVLFLLRTVLRERLDRMCLFGAVGLTIMAWFNIAIARTDVWHQFAHWMLS